MTGINHAFTNAHSDGGDATLTKPSNWDADHIINGDVQFSGNNIKTTGTSFTITTESAGTPKTTTLGGTTGLFGVYGDVLDLGANVGALEVRNSVNSNGPRVYLHENIQPSVNAYSSIESWTKDSIGTYWSPGAVQFFVTNSTNGSVASDLRLSQYSSNAQQTIDFNNFNFYPGSTSINLGAGTVPWGNLFLKSGGKVDFGNGEANITETLISSGNSKQTLNVTSASTNVPALTLGATSGLITGAGFGHIFDFGSATDFATFQLQDQWSGVSGPILSFFQDSASPAVGDSPGQIIFQGRDSATNSQEYARIKTYVSDPTSTSEDCLLMFQVTSAGSALTSLTLGQVPIGPFGHEIALGPTDNSNVCISSATTGANGSTLLFWTDSSSPAANDIVGRILADGRSSTNVVRQYGGLEWDIVSPTNAAETSKAVLSVINAGANNNALTVGPGGLQVGAPTGGDKGAGTINCTSIYFGGGTALSIYEDGSWTPVLTTSGTNFTSVTYSNRTGYYRRVGNLVFVSLLVTTSAVTVGSATGNVIISGLPYTASSAGQHHIGVAFQTGWTTVLPNAGYIANSGSVISLMGTISNANLAPANVSATTNSVYMSGCYGT